MAAKPKRRIEMAERKRRTFRRTDRVLVFYVNEGNSYEVIGRDGNTAILVPGDVIVDFPQMRHTMRVTDFLEMVEKESWRPLPPNPEDPDPRRYGPCRVYVREQIRKLVQTDTGDPSVVELEVDGKPVLNDDQTPKRGFVEGIVREFEALGFSEVWEA